MTDSRGISCILRSGTPISQLSREMWWSLGMAVSSHPPIIICSRHCMLDLLFADWIYSIVNSIGPNNCGESQVGHPVHPGLFTKFNMQYQIADRQDRLRSTTCPARIPRLVNTGGMLSMVYQGFSSSLEPSCFFILSLLSSSSAVLGSAPR